MNLPLAFQWITTCLAVMFACLGSPCASAQEPTPPRTGEQKDLTEGLLDLLKEPAQSSGKTSPEQAPPTTKAPLDGEDIGQAANPLAEVQLGMSTLAQWMRGNNDPKRTQQLQRDVVARLDDLIGQMEKQSSSSSSSSSSSQNSSQASSKSDAQNQPPASASAGRQPQADGTQPGNPSAGPAGNQASAKSSSGNQPGDPNAAANDPSDKEGGNAQSGTSRPGVSPLRSRNVAVDLNDPRALQRSAWGSLPERVREQMQSRMVERFLPSHREEIEAYYRALVK